MQDANWDAIRGMRAAFTKVAEATIAVKDTAWEGNCLVVIYDDGSIVRWEPAITKLAP